MNNNGRGILQTVLVFLGIFAVGGVPLARAHGIHFYAGDLSPFIRLEPEGPPTGFSVVLLQAVMREAGETFFPENIEVTNWARAVHEVEVTPGKALLALAMLPERRDRFKWVGPINKMPMGLFARKSAGIVLSGKDDILKYRIGVVRNTAPILMLVNAYPGIQNNLVQLSSIQTQLRMLREGRVDLILQGILASEVSMKAQGMDVASYPLVYSIESAKLYFGFNKATDDAYIAKLQAGLDRLKVKDASGTSPYERLKAQYFPSEKTKGSGSAGR